MYINFRSSAFHLRILNFFTNRHSDSISYRPEMILTTSKFNGQITQILHKLQHNFILYVVVFRFYRFILGHNKIMEK